MNSAEPAFTTHPGHILIPATPHAITLFDAVSLVASIASVVLAIVAIWLALRFKRDSDAVNGETKQLLSDIRSEAKVITQFVGGELHAYGQVARGIISSNTISTNMTTGTAEVPREPEHAE